MKEEHVAKAGEMMENLRSENRSLQEQKEAWRIAFYRLMACCESGGRRGRPMDLITAKDWKWMSQAKDKAEQLHLQVTPKQS